ncbi:unnamed protein product [Lymnaea stagnalis]|uniref:BTB domain-containing protein n=1 Tax=Lymnaea stagnalis TaxID=6523 RepID=A0AAV2I6T8_LYMST
MDFSKFRESGDLSDLTVVVESHEHRLHRFPLYARSDFFCELTRTKPGNADPSRVELKDFPGGNDVFVQVADFCYNMPLNITKNNVVQIRCAAEYLKMAGPGNLADVADKFLKDSFATARLNRSVVSISSLLVQCNKIGQLAQDAGIVELCTDAFIECWAKPSGAMVHIGSGRTFSGVSKLKESKSAFTRIQDSTPPGQMSSDKLEEASVKCLMSLRSGWFVRILTKAKDKGISLQELGALAVNFISCHLNLETHKNGISQSIVMSSAAGSSERVDVSTDSGAKDADASPRPGTDKQGLTTTITFMTEISDLTTSPVSDFPKVTEDIGEVIDRVLLALPEKAYSLPSVTMEWLTKIIRVATAHSCQCRGLLVSMAAEMMAKLEPEELCAVSPSVLHDVVVDLDSETSSGLQKERACKLVDTYMGQMTSKGILTAETFRLLASATNTATRTSHDPLFEVLEFVLKSETDKLTPAQRTELTELVNFDLLSETSLQKALEDEIVPASTVARSSIKLCSRLRSELASVKYIAESQEEDLHKYQGSSAHAGTGKYPSSAAEVTRHFSSYALRDRNLDSGYADTSETSRGRSPAELLLAAELETSEHLHSSDPLRAAQSLLTAARHKLAVPVYTGYRPTHLSRLLPTSPAVLPYVYHPHNSSRDAVEHDISLEEELEFKYDRSFRSLDPRVRHHRLWGHQLASQSGNAQKSGTYFPYTNYHRF